MVQIRERGGVWGGTRHDGCCDYRLDVCLGAALAGCVLASVARESEAGEETPSQENGGAVTLELAGGVTAGACSIGPSFIHCDISSTDENNSSAVETHW